MRGRESIAVQAAVPSAALHFSSYWMLFGAKLFRALRTISFRRRVSSLRLRESMALGDRKSLVVVQWQDRHYLLGISPQTMQVLDSREVAIASQQNGRADTAGAV